MTKYLTNNHLNFTPRRRRLPPLVWSYISSNNKLRKHDSDPPITSERYLIFVGVKHLHFSLFDGLVFMYSSIGKQK